MAQQSLTEYKDLINGLITTRLSQKKGKKTYKTDGEMVRWSSIQLKIFNENGFVLKCLPSALHPICWYATMNGIAFPLFVRFPFLLVRLRNVVLPSAPSQHKM